MFLFFMLACSDDDSVKSSKICSFNDPIEGLAWLKADVEEWEQSVDGLAKYFFVEHGRYENKDVFIYNHCCPFCYMLIPVYDCNGDQIQGISFDEVQSRKVISKHQHSECIL